MEAVSYLRILNIIVSYTKRYKYIDGGKVDFLSLKDFSLDQLQEIPQKSWGSKIKDEQVLSLLYWKDLSFEDLNNVSDPLEFL